MCCACVQVLAAWCCVLLLLLLVVLVLVLVLLMLMLMIMVLALVSLCAQEWLIAWWSLSVWHRSKWRVLLDQHAPHLSTQV